MSATDHLEPLAQALGQGRPLVLLLGQDAWRSGARPNPVVEAAYNRVGRPLPSDGFANLAGLVQTEPLPEGFYDWLAERYSRQAEPLWLEPIAKLPLNAVFTSSVDPALARAFRISGREVEAVLSSLDSPAAPRQRRNLHITYLFGRAGERNSNESPPRSTRELRQRTAMHASALLARLVETTTSLGLLLIDGLVCERDWLNSDLLSGVLSALSPGQVYWFGWDAAEPSAEAKALQELVAPHGPIVFVRERLSAALRSLELAHKIDLATPLRSAMEGMVTIQDHVLEIEPAVRLKVSTAAAIVDDTWIVPLPPLGSEAEYAEFRRFHGHVEDARRLVEGLRRGFAIERSFEAKMAERVGYAITNTGRVHEPILIHGQSGSGKSLALARLAYRIREEGKCAVLLSSRTTRIPAVEELDEFCLRAEDAGATATVVVCDANLPAQRYGDLHRGLASRGRRFVVVGSTYRIVDVKNTEISWSHSENLLEVPAELDDKETTDLTNLVTAKAGTKLQAQPTSFLLSALYRMLPDVRPRLAAGLAQEARVAEDDLRARGKANVRTPKPAGALGQALISAGLVDPKTLLDQKLETFLGVLTDAASKAIDYVMVPGKLDCPVPLNLLMRAIGGGDNLTDVANLFSGIDLFRWSPNEDDDIFVHPRLRVEAELICARRLGTSRAETEVALQLIANANPGSYGSCERRFVLDLVHKLGPDGLLGQRYAASYLHIARALTTLRTKTGTLDPSLMLQEATLRRRVFRDAPAEVDADSAAVLEEARQVVDLALGEFGGKTGRGLRRACANLKVERAAIYGFRAVQRLKSGAPPNEVWQFYTAARDSARSAIFAADSYYAIDVGIWIPNDLLRDGNWSDEQRAELVADILDGLERVDREQLAADELERFEQRRIKVGQTLGDNELQQSALDALERLGSRAGLLLQARALGGDLRGAGRATGEDISKAERVTSFMKSRASDVREDARCLRYFLRALWIDATQSYLFGGERAPLPERDEALDAVLALLENLGSLEGTLGDPRTQYLRAVVLWRLQREHAARDAWNTLSQESAFNDPRRVIRHHVWTEGGGMPRLFHGRVSSGNAERGRVRVQVDELRQEVELLQRDFPQVELRRGAGVPGGFHLAFNFIGPVADPPHRPRSGR
ncbi:MAG TPA: hypothetical protein VKM72_00700 [Thermoanaerobaculia bacterium]|nr:hypothetical protein [Thermoanaerobaculia bacterium]